MGLWPGTDFIPDDTTGAGAFQTQQNYQPSTSDYLNAVREDTYMGRGSAYGLYQASQIQSIQGNPIAEADWNKNNPAWRSDIVWKPGLNDGQVQALATLNDHAEDNAFVRQQASGLMGTTTFPLRMAMQVTEPVNAAELIATTALTGGAGALFEVGAANSVRLAALSRTLAEAPAAAKLAATAVGEGGVFTGVSAPADLAYGNMTYAQDKTSGDYLKEVGMNSLMIAGLHLAGSGLSMAARKVIKDGDPQVFDNINAQIQQGVAPDVEAAITPELINDKVATQDRLDILNQRKVETANTDTPIYDKIADLQDQKLAIESGIDTSEPNARELVNAVKDVREEAITPKDDENYEQIKSNADSARETLQTNGYSPDELIKGVERGNENSSFQISDDQKAKLAPIDQEINELKSQTSGPDTQADLRAKIADHQSQLSSFPSDNELKTNLGGELNRRLSTDNQATYKSSEKAFADEVPQMRSIDHDSELSKEVEALQKESPEVADKFAEIDAEGEKRFNALDAALGCLKRG